MEKTLGLDKSPKKRFTNGYTWADVLRATLISKFLNDDKIKKILHVVLEDITWIMQI